MGVEICKNRKGVIRFEGVVGPVGQCFGIELDTTIDTGTDGTFDGERYFECKDGKGTFVKTTRIKRKLAISTRPKPKTPKTPKTPKQGLDDKKEDENKQKNQPKNALIDAILKKKKKSKNTKTKSTNKSKSKSTKANKPSPIKKPKKKKKSVK